MSISEEAKLKEDEVRLWVTRQRRRRPDQDLENVGNRLDKSCKPGSEKACSTDPSNSGFHGSKCASWEEIAALI